MNITTANPLPKIRFQESASNISEHRAMLESRAFQRAADFALLQYQTRLAAQIGDGATAMASGFKLEGAMEFLETLRLLGQTTQIGEPRVSGQLDHRA